MVNRKDRYLGRHIRYYQDFERLASRASYCPLTDPTSKFRVTRRPRLVRKRVYFRLEVASLRPFATLKHEFGIGGETLGRVIVKKLYAKANVPLDFKTDRSFTDNVEQLKRILFEEV